MSISVTLNIDGPRDPHYVLEVAEAFSQAVRVMNHLTRDHAALRYPSEVDGLVCYLSAAAAMTPQLLGQVSRWLAVEQEAGRVRVPAGEHAGNPVRAVAAARTGLDAASVAADAFREVLEVVASVTANLGAAEGNES